ncbi:hypothetical protein HA402_015273 [Bradysia odoriphaga]|nr:hypothetical protein HA402_015273 [Bradysia odoriphaga]
MVLFIVLLLFLLPNQSIAAYYRIFSLHTLCPPEKSNTWIDSVYHDKDATTIDLHDKPLMSSVLIEHVWDNSSYKHFHHCEFNIKARSKWLQEAHSGLFAAVRQLNFRQNPAGDCIDYVIFEVNTLTAPTSHKICGTVDDEFFDENNYFEAPEGSLKVVVHIGPHNMEPNKIIMKLSFTAFEDCTGSYKFRCTNSRCISDNLYNDLVINCIPPFCTDEPRYYRKCGTSPAFIPPKGHVLLIGSMLIVVIFLVAMSWYFLKLTSTEVQSPVVEAKYTPRPTKLEELNVHSLLHIISFLNVLDTINLGKTSKLMKSMAKQSYIRFSHISFGNLSVDVYGSPSILEEIGDDVRSVEISGLNVQMLDCLLKCCPNLTDIKLIDSSNIFNSMSFGKYLPLLKNITNLEIRKSEIYYSKMNRAKRFQNFDSLLASLTEIDKLNSLKIDFIETGDKTFHLLKSIKNLKYLHLNRYLATAPIPPIIPTFSHLKEYLLSIEDSETSEIISELVVMG